MFLFLLATKHGKISCQQLLHPFSENGAKKAINGQELLMCMHMYVTALVTCNNYVKKFSENHVNLDEVPAGSTAG